MTHVARRKVTGALIAGGKSIRMGRDKALLDFAGAPMVAWCAASLAECAPTLIVACADERHALRCKLAIENAWPTFNVLRGVSVETVVDEVLDAGPLAGMAAAFSQAQSEHVVVSPCDTPLVPAEYYRRAVGLLGRFEGVALALGVPDALTSAWRREAVAREAPELLRKREGPRGLLTVLNTSLVGAPELLEWGLDPARFRSANTPGELADLLALARGRP